MAEVNSTHTGGIGICGLLGVAFVVLKLTKVIDWSWWWVLVPFWGPLVITLGVLLVVGIVLGIVWLIRERV